MKNDAPFLDANSFVMEEVSQETSDTSASSGNNSPFLSVYESEESGSLIDPETEEYVAFLNELYDEEFDGALSGLVNEAAAVYESHFMQEREDSATAGYQAERLLDEHFAPLVEEAEAMLGTLATELSKYDPNSLSEEEIETLVDRYEPSVEMNPSFENFFGKLKGLAKKVAQKAVNIAKKGVKLAAKIGLGPVLRKLRLLIKPLLKQVMQRAIGRLPAQLQPIARKLARRVPFLREVEEGLEPDSAVTETYEIAQLQYEFDQQVANLLFASSEVEQDLEVAQALGEQPGSDGYPLAELDQARDQFVESLMQLKEGEDPGPHVDNFVPAILPALRIGIRLIGRKRVVNFLAKFLSRLINRFVGPQYARPLSQAIADAGLRLMQLEASEATGEEEFRPAASAVAATVEETVRRVAALPDYVLDDQELLEGFTLEAFEQAAAANLPPVLSDEAYRKRPELAGAGKLRGIWMMMPRGRGKAYKYKKFSRTIPIRVSPHKVASLESFEGITLGEHMEERLGVEPGEEVEALVHLYEAIPGGRLADITRLDEHIMEEDAAGGPEQLHPFSSEAAGLLVGESELGREVDPANLSNPNSTTVGQRYYYLEIPGRRLLKVPGASGRAKIRRATRVRLILDFPKNEIRVYLFLSEIRAQEIAVKLRQHAHIGAVAARLRGFIFRGLRGAFKGAFGRLKIVHEAVTPDQWLGALRRLPSLVPKVLLGKLTEWVIKGLSDHLKQHKEELIKAAEDTADGVTLIMKIGNPPGFPQLRQALKGKGLSLSSLKMPDGTPPVNIEIKPGYTNE